MLILIDGYNVIAPVAAPGRGTTHRWLQAERQRLIDQLVTGLDKELACQTTVVFDAAAAPPGLESRYVQSGIEIEFAIGYREADDRLEELISQHSSPKRLTVVSSDHRIQSAARRRGALAVNSDVWLDRLIDGRVLLAIPVASADLNLESADKKPDVCGVPNWLKEFGIAGDLPPDLNGIDSPFPPGYGDDLL